MFAKSKRIPVLPRDFKRAVGQQLEAHSGGHSAAVEAVDYDERLQRRKMMNEESKLESDFIGV